MSAQVILTAAELESLETTIIPAPGPYEPKTPIAIALTELAPDQWRKAKSIDLCSTQVWMDTCDKGHGVRARRGRCGTQMCPTCAPRWMADQKARYGESVGEYEGKPLWIMRVFVGGWRAHDDKAIRRFADAVQEKVEGMGIKNSIIAFQYDATGRAAHAETPIPRYGYLIATILLEDEAVLDPKFPKATNVWLTECFGDMHIDFVTCGLSRKELMHLLFDYEIPTDPREAAEVEAAWTGFHRVRAHGRFYKVKKAQPVEEPKSAPTEVDENFFSDGEEVPLKKLPKKGAPICPICGGPATHTVGPFRISDPMAQLSHPRWRGGG